MDLLDRGRDRSFLIVRGDDCEIAVHGIRGRRLGVEALLSE
jgi:hypothetical protein